MFWLFIKIGLNVKIANPNELKLLQEYSDLYKQESKSKAFKKTNFRLSEKIMPF